MPHVMFYGFCASACMNFNHVTGSNHIKMDRRQNSAQSSAGSDFQIDSTKPVTVTTQSITNDDGDHDKPMEVNQRYQQDGKTTDHSSYTVTGKQHNTTTGDFCSDFVSTTQDHTKFLGEGVL